MPSRKKTKKSAASPSGRGALRRGLLVLGVLVVVVGLVPAWQRAWFVYYVSAARSALSEFDFSAALVALEKAERQQPDRADVQYLLAVANRRSGHVDQVEPRLKSAEHLGWPLADIERQRLLLRTQVGRFHEVEKQLQALFAAQTDDEAALEIYESLAHGYWANHRIQDTIKALDYWIQWRPRDTDPRVMRADIYIEFNDPVSAEKEYRAILEIAPQHILAHEMLGRLLLEASKVDEAAEQFRYCATHGAANASVLSELAECEFRSSRPEEADRWLSRIKLDELPPERRAKVLKLKADIARFRQHNVEALAILTQAIEEWPHDSGVHQSLGQTYAALGQRELATKHLDISKEILVRAERFSALQRRVVTEPDDPNLRYQVAEILVAQGLRSDAVGWWRSAIRSDAKHQPSHEALADYYAETGKPELAENHRHLAAASVDVSFRRAWGALSASDLEGVQQLLPLIAKYPEFASHARLLEAALLVKAGEHAPAARQLQSPLRWPALRPLALVVAAESLISQGQPLAAEPLLLEALQLNEEVVDAHRWLAVIYYDLGAVDQAETHLNRVAALDPPDYRAHRLLGLMSKDYENFDAAIVRYQAALQRNPPDEPREEILIELSECLLKQKAFAEALQTLEAAAPSVERSVMMAECLYNTNRRDEAVQLLDQVLVEAPKNAAALVLRGDAALLAAENERAVEWLERAVAEQPFEFAARYKLSQALARVGQDVESRAQLQRSEELKQLREKFAKLHEQAIAKPFDAPLRRELATTADLLGRPDLAKVWTKAAETIEARGATPAADTDSAKTDSPKTP